MMQSRKTNTNHYLALFSIFMLLMVCLGCNTQDKEWFIKATYHEACSCNAPCPCPYGLPMTNSFCRLNSYIEIQKSEYKNINLSGLKVILSGGSGEAGEFFVMKPVTKSQLRALHELIKTINPGSFKEISFGGIVPMQFENKNQKIKYSTNNIKVELKAVLGADHKPVTVKNLKGKIFEEYTPYLAITNSRNCIDTTSNFVYKNKAAFVAKWNFSNLDFK